MAYRRVLVTGGTGFIGSHLVERLLEDGRDVRVLSLKRTNLFEAIEEENLKIIKDKGAEIVYGDLRDKKSLRGIADNIDIIFHLGAISRPMNIPSKQYYDVNEKGTKNILEEAIKSRVKKFIHVSTVSVLGVSPDGHPLKENEFQEEKADYGLSKRAGEKVALNFYKKYKLPVVVLRPCLVYGPRCMVRLIMFKFVQRGLFPLFNKGMAKMEFVYVDNVIQSILLAEKNNHILGEVFNITDGQSYTIKRVLTTIAQEEGVTPPRINLPYFIGKTIGYLAEIISKPLGVYPPFSSTAADWMSKSINVYDCSKAKKMLGYKPKVSLREGAKRTIEWYRKKGVLN